MGLSQCQVSSPNFLCLSQRNYWLCTPPLLPLCPPLGRLLPLLLLSCHFFLLWIVRADTTVFLEFVSQMTANFTSSTLPQKYLTIIRTYYDEARD